VVGVIDELPTVAEFTGRIISESMPPSTGCAVPLSSEALPPLGFSGVGELEWSLKAVGSVKAGRERVITWWTHHDRKADLRDRIEASRAVAGFSQTESTVDGLRVRVTTWTDRSGWRHESRVETRLDQNGTPIRNEDGSIPVGQSTTLRAPLGYKMIFTCVGQIDFNRQGDATEVILSHDHKVVGGTRFNRRGLQRSDEKRQLEDFRYWIDHCQDALSNSDSPEPG
jgi:hypothetical protein